jgi:hypothetical protein
MKATRIILVERRNLNKSCHLLSIADEDFGGSGLVCNDNSETGNARTVCPWSLPEQVDLEFFTMKVPDATKLITKNKLKEFNQRRPLRSRSFPSRCSSSNSFSVGSTDTFSRPSSSS